VPLCREPRLFLANPPRVLDPHFRQRSRLKRPKEMMEKDFDLYYTPGINSPSPEMRTATAMQYAAYQLGQINQKLDRIIAALGSTS
jgi:hypothetical protein